ncbi:MAG: DUF503 domain-containing protein [Thermoanaerobaculia bacterium]
MFVGVTTFELHIPHAHSLKEKRMIVKSLRDRLRNRFEVSVAEVALQDLHQRARLAVAVVSGDAKSVDRILEAIGEFVEENTDARVIGRGHEVIQFDDEAPLELPGGDFEQEFDIE